MKNKTILGTFSGKCADATVTNLNGMDITRPVWENVFSSEEYKKGIERGHYIGFLGHPEEPDCQDFEHACIVMTSGKIDDSGEVFGEFDLIDTPVGRIVKTFIDAGVSWGISVRGAGDVINNSVDPDTFVFRGFDLVAFPAYDDCIPTFTEIAASTNKADRAKYKKICAAVDTELESISSIGALDQIQANFAKQSDTYNKIEERKHELEQGVDKDVEIDDDLETITADKLNALTELYMDSCVACENLRKENEELKEAIRQTSATASRRIKAIERITAAQMSDVSEKYRSLQNQNATLIAANRKIKTENEKLSKDNLSYEQKAKITAATVRSKDSTISALNTRLDETVNASGEFERRASNLDEKVKNLEAQLVAANKSAKAASAIADTFKEAYARLYANAVGVDLSTSAILACKSIDDIRRLVDTRSLPSSKSSIMASRITPYEEVDIVGELNDDDLAIL